MKKFVSTFVLLLVLWRSPISIPKINVAKAEPKTIVVPARASRGSDGIPVAKSSPATKTRCYRSKRGGW
ncbi:MAG: hypothetical protein OEW95_04740 [Candidatus Bathyarchaeota archaeon]|nr:hypothetical protein [Candidatus Bathyarchaeota archaeon]